MKIFLSQSGGDQVNLLQANLNAVYLSLAFIAVPSFIICFSLVFKKQLSKQATNLLYAFTIGFFLMTGFFELFEGIETALENYKDGVFLKLLSNVGTAILVLGIVIFFKFFVKFKFNHKLSWNSPRDHHHDHLPFHNHPHIEEVLINLRTHHNPNHFYKVKEKIFAIVLTLPHRLIAGFLLGYIVANGLAKSSPSPFSFAFLFAFFLHLIPEEMIVCYRLRETGISWFKTTVYSFIMNLLLLGPTLFLGANLGNKIEEVPFLEIMMKTMVGILFFFIAVFEFLPEVMAESKTQKTWLSAIIMAGIGLIFALILVNFHQHPEHSS